VIEVVVDAGQRTGIENVTLTFQGAFADALAADDAIAKQRRIALIEDLGLGVGQFFRESDWRDAKTQLTETLRSDVYAAARITDSAANVDADNYRADLQVEVDSGPPFFWANYGSPVCSAIRNGCSIVISHQCAAKPIHAVAYLNFSAIYKTRLILERWRYRSIPILKKPAQYRLR
jgi:uncharacterized protein YceK